MLRESSISTPRKFCCGTAALRISVGRNRQKISTASTARRRPTSTMIAGALDRRQASIREQRATATAVTPATTSSTPRQAVGEIAC
jgi:hypothetical protein